MAQRPTLFLYYGASEPLLQAWCRQNPSAPLLIFQVNHVLEPQACPAGTRFVTYEDYLSAAELAEIDGQALALACTWYRRGEDVTLLQGLSLGELYELDMMGFLSRTFKNAIALSRLVASEAPGEIVAGKDLFAFPLPVVEDSGGLLLRLAQVAGPLWAIPVTLLPPEAPGARPSLAPRTCALVGLTLHSKAKGLLTALWRAYWRLRRLLERPPRRPGVLIFPYFRLLPLVQHLMKEPDLRLLILGSFGLRGDTYLAGNLRHLIVSDYVNKSEYQGVAQAARELFRQRWELLQGDQGFRDLFVHQGLPLWEVVREKLAWLFHLAFPQWALHCHDLKACLASERIKLIVVPQDELPDGRALVLVGNALGIPTLLVQHGRPVEYPFWVQTKASRIAAWGQTWRRWHLLKGVPPERVVVTGEISFDSLPTMDPELSRATVARRLGLSAQGQWVVVTSQPHGAFSALSSYLDQELVALALFQTMQELRDYQFVLKFHYNHDGAFQTELARRRRLPNVRLLPHKEMLNRGLTLHQLLSAADLLVTVNSTTALEALLLGKPVVLVNLGGKPDLGPYATRGPALGVYREEELTQAIRATVEEGYSSGLWEEKRRSFLEEEVENWLSRDATAQVTRLIRELAGVSSGAPKSPTSVRT